MASIPSPSPETAGGFVLDAAGEIPGPGGRLEGFTLCGAFGSRPVIRVNRATVTDSTGAQYYTGEDDD